MPEIEHDGVKIFFEVTGEGPAVVLGHSFLCSGDMWAPQVPRLAERHRVVNIDLRGHGRSGPLSRACDVYDLVGDVVAVLDHLEIESAVWAGLSIGGMVAMRAAITVPRRVRALVLLDTDAEEETAYKKFKYRAMNLGARAIGIRPFVPAVLPLMFGATTRRSRPELVNEWRGKFSAIHMPSISIVLEALARRDSVVDRLQNIEVPTLVIVGAEDASLPVPCARKISSAVANASLVVVPGAGHLSTLEQPEAVTRAMTVFLESLP
jgi:3-oxoadipate enol-lactonase